MPSLIPSPNTFGNEFFILVDPVDGFAFEETEISSSTILSADTPEGPFTITNATNAGSIVITIGAHTLSPGRGVFIDGVGGNLAANGFFLISAAGGTTITISVAGSGAYTTGGTLTVANDITGHSLSLGEIVLERDVLAVNSSVVGGGQVRGRVSYAY